MGQNVRPGLEIQRGIYTPNTGWKERSDGPCLVGRTIDKEASACIQWETTASRLTI